MKELTFDFNNMFNFNIGGCNGVSEEDLRRMGRQIKTAHRHLTNIIKDPESRADIGLEWTQLPYQDKKTVKEIQSMGDEIAARYDSVISLGIGGSYLGLKAAQDALCPPYYNEFSSVRNGRPKIYFEGNNLDPEPLKVLLNNLSPKKTAVIVISKSGETTETKAMFKITEEWLKKGVGAKYGRQIFAVTDPVNGSLRALADERRKKDKLSFRSLPIIKGVGGRFSELNMGLLHLAIVGIDIGEVLKGAKLMFEKCLNASLFRNPAYMYAALHTILYRKKNKSQAVIMPFSEGLKSTGDWYVQLLAESLGKKYARKVVLSADGRESWQADRKKVLHTGRTPISARGTNDLHSIQQNNIEGENNKAVTFIRVEKFRNDLSLPATGDFISRKKCSALLSVAQEATEWALVAERRPNCTVIMPEVTPFLWGQLLLFFEMATAFEGELLNVNAYNQPGVEGYKNYMYYKLKKPGISKDIEKQICKAPLKKKKKFVI